MLTNDETWSIIIASGDIVVESVAILVNEKENSMDHNERRQAEREQFIDKLIAELPTLRTKLELSQDELANMVGITRQTYSSMETGKRKMTWSTFLSLIYVFDNNERTHDYIQKAGLSPSVILGTAPCRRTVIPISSSVQMNGDDIINHLDDQAIHAIETLIMVEYARCESLTGEDVIKAFNGKQITLLSQQDRQARRALKEIKASNRGRKK